MTKYFTMEKLEKYPAFERKRIRLGMSKEEFIDYENNVVAPRVRKALMKNYEDYVKDKVSPDGKTITKYDSNTNEHVTYDIETGKVISRVVF